MEIFKKDDYTISGLSAEESKEIVQGLSKILADTYALYLKTQNYHWNVKGARFRSLHKLFEEHYLELAPAIDDIAERIRSLGYYTPGSFESFLELKSIQESFKFKQPNEMISDLQNNHSQLVINLRYQCKLAESAFDYATADLLTKRIDYHEKTGWMLGSLLEGENKE